MPIYFPNRASLKCFLSEQQATEYIQKEGGSLMNIPAFDSREDAEKWIQQQNNQEYWDVSYFDNSILVDNNGNQVETTQRSPGQKVSTMKNLEKPEFIYCTETAGS